MKVLDLVCRGGLRALQGMDVCLSQTHIHQFPWLAYSAVHVVVTEDEKFETGQTKNSVLIIFISCFCDMYTSQVKVFFFRHMYTSQVKACDDVMESSRLHLRCSLYSKQWPQFVTP